MKIEKISKEDYLVGIVNSIKKDYPEERQESKPATFALTYHGTFVTLMNNCGFSKEVAQAIYNNYHEMYVVSDAWVEERIKFAAKHGYTEVAFGLRLRTPTLKNCVYGSKSMPYEAIAESRTVGNAQGQSYGLLNNRSAIEIQWEVLNSPYAEDILPISHIHDAQYWVFKQDPEVIAWANKLIVTSMQWQDLDAIRHDEVHLGGDLDLFFPNWAYGVTLPNNVEPDQIPDIVVQHQNKVYSNA